MYTEERSLNNETMALVAETTSQSTLAFAETTAGNKPTLQRGSTGQAVKELQQLLYHWGYYSGAIDGIFGIQVHNGVKGYQHRVFLQEDGIVGPITWQALYSGAPVNMPVVMKGSSGNAVKIVQNVLKMNGYYFGSIDGFFGAMTDVAVRQLQLSKALPQDGIVGYKTWHALSKLRH
ncbi:MULTISPECIES: peptidoglycan-binding protein [unclassified Microcoleus]|uniref:peptidoglycan-binding protein n=1 Tax=unclassified Microcoleus TaxID=2642155 RepID=UPI002FD747AE